MSIRRTRRSHLILHVLSLACLATSDARAQTAASVSTPDTSPQTLRISFPQGADWKSLPFETSHGVIVFRAMINGRPATLLFDNGTERTTIDQRFAERAGLQLSGSALGMQTGSSRLSTRRADGFSLEMPHVLSIHGSVPATDLSNISAALDRRIDAILGGDVLDKLAILIRPAQGTIALVASGAITPPQKTKVISLGVGSSVAAIVGGKPARLKIDLGFSGAVRLTDGKWALLETTGLAVSADSQTTADGIVHATKTVRTSVVIGHVSATDVPVASGYSDRLDGDGLLGNGFFSHADTLLDVSRGLLVVLSPSPPAAAGAAPANGRTG